MKARRVVNKLLESDEGIDDPKEYALSTYEPPPTVCLVGNLAGDVVPIASRLRTPA